MTNGLTDEAIAAYAADLLEIEAAIEQGQDDKKNVYANLRETYGKRAADSLKLAIKRHRMDADKRTEADEIDAEAERFLMIIRKPSAPRATRTREIIEEFDPETGEIKPTQHQPRESTGAVPTKVAVDANAGGENVAAPTAQDTEILENVDGTRDGGLAPISDVEPVAPHSEPASPLPEIAEPGDPTTGHMPTEPLIPADAGRVVATNVLSIRTHNPDTHFLNSEGLLRLHGCLKPGKCGSSEPRKKLCFNCSVQHEGPTYQDGAA